jgi:hypothetical protein
MRMMIPFLFATTPLISLHEMAVIVKSQGGWFQARQVHNVSVISTTISRVLTRQQNDSVSSTTTIYLDGIAARL